jgi:SecD/SecF fusion protein
MSTAQKHFVDTKMGQIDHTGLNHDTLSIISNSFQTEFRDSFNEKPFMDMGILKYTYPLTKMYEIKRGLDLQGGMSFVLEVQSKEILKSLSNNSKNPTFMKALETATANQSSSQEDFLTLFGKAYTAVDPAAKMADVFAPLQNFQGKISINDNNDQVIGVLRENLTSAYKNSFNVIKTRINQTGLNEPNVSLQEGTGRIIVELPGADDATRIKNLMESAAKLEFWHTYEGAEVMQSFVDANETLKGVLSLKKEETKSDDTNAIAAVAENALGIVKPTGKGTDSAKSDKKFNPLFEILQLNIDQQGRPQEGAVIGFAEAKDIRMVNEYLNNDLVKANFKKDLKLLWGAKPYMDGKNFYALYAIKSSMSGEAPLTGDVIVNARNESDQFGKPGIGMTMNTQGSAIWERMTTQASSDPVSKKCIAIVLDNLVQSAPRVSNPIAGGKSQISGNFSIEEALDMANTLNSGKLDAPAKIIQESIVGPSLGQETINAGLLSLLIGVLVIFVFMFLNYKVGGLIADVALMFNLLFLLGILASLKSVLTLPGIAGIVLIIGAAVDANVIIYERIKEELKNGKAYATAVAEGFSKSYSAIIDANVTTLITSVTLIFFGYGPVKGFAVTLTIGIFTSLFTAVLLTREFYTLHMNRGKEVNFGTSIMDKLFGNINFEFIKKRKIAYIISMISIIAGTASIMTRGFELGVDFKGGRSYVVEMEKKEDLDALRSSLNKSLDAGTQVKTYGAENQIQIVTSFMYDDKNAQSKTSDSLVLSGVYEGLKPFYKSTPSHEDFVAKKVSNSVKIDATIADDIRKSAFWVSIIAIIGIFIYVTLRYPRWQFAAGAIAALIHDLFFTLGILSIFHGFLPVSLEMNQTIIAAILTILGYSTNDTMVIFDRIREYMKLKPNDNLEETVNSAVNKTLARTVMTSTTLLLVILVLFFVGGQAIESFAFTMLIGILVGTYSSIFVASPVSVDLINWLDKKKANN